MNRDGKIPQPRSAPRGVVALALLAIAWSLYQVPIRWEWDTQQLHLGLSNLVRWAADGAEGPVQARPFPPFQYLTGLPFVLAARAGVPVNVFWFWALASLLSLGGTCYVLWRVGRRYATDAVAWLLVVIVLTGPLITYAPSTFNELPAALVTALFAATVVGRGGPVVAGVLFVAAGLTKEIAAPLLVVMWLAGLALRQAQLGRAGLIRHALAMGVAFAMTMAAHAGFNWLRYGSILNVHYLAPEHLIHSWPRRAQNAVALWLSPSGGVVPFWPTLVIVSAVGLVRRRSPNGAARLVHLIPAAAVALLLAMLTFGLSGFYQPFGWWCWGPRLVLPWLPAALLVLVRAYPRAFEHVGALLLKHPASFAATAALACAAALPHLMMLASPSVVPEFFGPDERFPHGAPPAEPELHYARQLFLAWQKWPPLLLRPLQVPPDPREAIAVVVYLGAIVILLWYARKSAVPSRQ